MKALCIIALLPLAAFGGDVPTAKQEPVAALITPTVQVSPPLAPPSDPIPINAARITTFENTNPSWYELPQYYNGVPKYSGTMGSYTAKHIPVAVMCELGKWATYSENHTGSLEIYSLNLNTGDKYLVHTVTGFTDPHQNAAIQCGGGKLYLTVSARSNTRLGYEYESTDGINWIQTGSGYRSYPQLHWLANGSLLTLYTEYKLDPTQSNGKSRKIYSSCNNQPIINDDIQHYMMSFYDGVAVHVVFNDLIGGPDFRTNLNYTRSFDGGCTWTTPYKWHTGDFVYLKDFTTIKGIPTALVTLSDSADPNIGNRGIYKITEASKTFIRDTNHNYTTGSIDNSTGGIMFPTGSDNYGGGVLLTKPYCNYARRVWNTNDEFVASCSVSGAFASTSEMIHIK